MGRKKIPNKIDTYEDVAIIYIRSPKYGKFRVEVDIEDLDVVSQYTWSIQKLNKAFYAITSIPVRKGRRTNLYLHRLLLKANNGMTVDHINHDTLNNRRSNLRICTYRQQMMNRRFQDRGSFLTKYKGVYPKRKGTQIVEGKFQAYVTVDGKRTYLGTFDTQEEAALAYDKKAREVYGEYHTNPNINLIPDEIKQRVSV